MKKAVVMLGSPRRRGNSEILAEKAMEGIKSAGGAYDVFRLNKMKIRPCKACDYCRREGHTLCAIHDDMDQIYAALSGADAILIACPIYMFTVTAQLKLFMDRCYACPDLLKGKRVGILLTYGNTDEHTSGAVNAMNTFRDEYRYAHAELVGIVHASASDKGEIVRNEKALEETFQLGKELFSDTADGIA